MPTSKMVRAAIVGTVLAGLWACTVMPRPGLSAPGEPVAIPGGTFSTSSVREVSGSFGRPPGTTGKVPAVLILHGSNGVDGRGAFYAKALQGAGFATLEITMFTPTGRPREGPVATLPHAAAALKWLAARPDIQAERLGVMGFSFGGALTVFLANELIQEQLGQDVPKPAAFAALYPVCGGMAHAVSFPGSPYFGAQKRMGAAPMLIQQGTRDDYETAERPCDAFVATWPAAAREHTTVRTLEGMTHGFDAQFGSFQFVDDQAHSGSGGTVFVHASPKDAAEAREAVVRFFLTYLKS